VSSMSFQPSYKPLSATQKEIRLLTLKAGSFVDDIQLHLSPVFLAASPTYDALSYTWGTEQPSTPVMIDGMKRQITSNLESALRHLRLPTQDRVMWVDTICINQQNNDERSHQVQMMGDIFSTANRVIAWIGAAAEDSDFVMRVMAQPNEELALRSLRFSFGFRALCERSWFRRVWIVQEVSLATREPLIVCGQSSVAWSDLQRCVSFKFENNLDDRPDGEEWDQYVAYLMTETRHSQRFELWENQRIRSAISAPSEKFADESVQSAYHAESIISRSGALLSLSMGYIFNLDYIRGLRGSACLSGQFHRTGGFHATDPRDKIYSLLAVSDFPDIKISPDYSKSIRQVFAEATAFILKEHFIYMYPSTSLSGKSDLNLPSWVPNLNQPDCFFTESDHPYYLCPDENTLQSLAEEMERFGPLAEFSQDYTILKTRGMHLGFITAISAMPARNFTRNAEWVQHTLQSLHRNHPTSSPKLILDALISQNTKPSESWNLPEEEKSNFLDNLPDSNQHTPHPKYQGVYDMLSLANKDRIFLSTDTGTLGVTNDDGLVEIGDAVIGLFGLNLPFILRKLDNGCFRMINVARIGGHDVGHDIPEDVTDTGLLYTDYGLRDYEIM